MSKRIFLDFASTTPLDTRVHKKMLPYFGTFFGNPSALYQEGIEVKKVVSEARTAVAQILNVRAEEVLFTGSGTESNNMAIRGVFNAYKEQFKPHIITTTIEHPSIIEICKQIEKDGGEVSFVPVLENGIVDPKAIAAALQPTTILVSVMLANNEIGTIQPIREIARVISEYKDKGISAVRTAPFLHTDASQAANYLDVSFQKLGVDIMTLDASKIYGPKGVGILAIRKDVSIEPIIFGGGQERGMRAGTENVSGIVGAAEALTMAHEIFETESTRLTELRDYFFTEIEKIIPGVIINGDRKVRLPNNVNICIPGLDAEFAVIKMDNLGVCCSSASSCMNLSEDSYSYVVNALPKQGNDCRASSLRFTFGRTTTRSELSLTIKKIQSII